jgi:hypothetical protein
VVLNRNVIARVQKYTDEAAMYGPPPKEREREREREREKGKAIPVTGSEEGP